MKIQVLHESEVKLTSNYWLTISIDIYIHINDKVPRPERYADQEE
jgi:hypothetical protein